MTSPLQEGSAGPEERDAGRVVAAMRSQLQRFVRIDNGTCTDCGGQWLFRRGKIDYATGEHRPWCAIHTIRGGESAPAPHHPNGTNPVTRYPRGEAGTE